jgi:hypothetical protein
MKQKLQAQGSTSANKWHMIILHLRINFCEEEEGGTEKR